MAINEFIEQLNSEGLAKTNRFQSTIFFPQQIRNPITLDYFLAYGITQNDAFRANMLCEVTEFPASSIATQEKREYGPTYKVPYTRFYDDLNMTFLVNQDMREKRFMDAWLDMIIDPKTGDKNYYNEYTSTIYLTQLDLEENEVYGIELTEAYPIQVSAMPLDNTASDTFHRLNVTMTYRKALTFNTIIPQKVRAYAKLGEIAVNQFPVARDVVDQVLTQKAGINNAIGGIYTDVFNLF